MRKPNYPSCRLIIGLSVALLWSACTNLNPPDTKNSTAVVVRGRVVGSEGPIEDVTVQVSGLAGRSKTGHDGYFEMADIPAGRYRLLFSRPGGTLIVPILVEPGRDLDLQNIYLRGGYSAAEPSETRPDLAAALLELGIDETAWDKYLKTGEIPSAVTNYLDQKKLSALVASMKETISVEAAAGILAEVSGRDPQEVRAWLQANLPNIPRHADGSFSLADLAAGLDRVRQEPLLREPAYFPAPETASHQLAAGQEIVLYEATRGTSPQEQNWWYLTDPRPAKSRTHRTAAVVSLDTTVDRQEKAGYFTQDPIFGEVLRHPGLPVLDRRTGFVLRFDAQVRQEKHVREDRAGFSVIVICDDRKGLELGFWKNLIWAQADNGRPIFQDSRAESVSFPTTNRLARYELRIQGNQYKLSADGRLILKGPLRNYTAFGGYPYTIPNFVFFGDDSSSAETQFDMAYISIKPAKATALSSGPVLELDPAAAQSATGTQEETVESRDAVEIPVATPITGIATATSRMGQTNTPSLHGVLMK